ncbi:MAG: RDD family protein [Pikeienuella sp.]
MTTISPEFDLDAAIASPIKRLFAFFIDVFLVWGIAIAVSIGSFGVGFLDFGGLLLVVDLIYRIATISTGSATWGMRMLGIGLRDKNGQKFDLTAASLHTIAFYIVLASVIIQFASALMMLGTERRQGLHDVLLGSVMVNADFDEV